MKVKRGEVSQLYVDAQQRQRDCDLCWNGSRAQIHLSQSIRLSSSSPGLSALVCSLSVHSFPPHSLLLRLVHPPTRSFSSPQHISPSRSALSFPRFCLAFNMNACSVCIYMRRRGEIYIYIYIYAFSRRFYPKRLTIAFRLYIFISMCVFLSPPLIRSCLLSSHLIYSSSQLLHSRLLQR